MGVALGNTLPVILYLGVDSALLFDLHFMVYVFKHILSLCKPLIYSTQKIEQNKNDYHLFIYLRTTFIVSKIDFPLMPKILKYASVYLIDIKINL